MPDHGIDDGGYHWRPLLPADAATVLGLHRAVLAGLPDPALVRPEQPAFFAGLLAGDGHIIGVFDGDRLIAYGVLQWRLEPGDNPRPQLQLAATTPIAKLAGVAVDPAHRGRGLQAELTRRRVALARAAGYPHLFATSAPANWPSWVNLVGQGFEVVALELKYGGLLRFLLHRGPASTAPADPSAELCRTDADDRLQRLLAAGFRGVAARRLADGHYALQLRPPLA